MKMFVVDRLNKLERVVQLDLGRLGHVENLVQDASIFLKLFNCESGSAVVSH